MLEEGGDDFLFAGGLKADGQLVAVGVDHAALAEFGMNDRVAHGKAAMAVVGGIDDLGRQDIDYNIQVINANPDVKIQLEGHCDERGTAEYNLALGQTRARAVQDILTSYGISSSRLSMISYGEEVPLDPGHTEAAFAKNRRVHFSAFRDTPKR